MCKVQSITFMFKDCESIEVPEKYIGSVFIGDIQRNIERIALGCIQEKLVCKEFYIEIFIILILIIIFFIIYILFY